ncbi:MAG: Zn-dependent hydrolase [Bacteroidota bacterium]
MRLSLCLSLCLLTFAACADTPDLEADPDATASDVEMTMQQRLDQYTPVRLTTDIELTENERAMIPLLIEASDAMDEVFWMQAYGDRDELLGRLDGPAREYAMINYGPHDRLDGDGGFLPSVGDKPLGANFYPADITKEELEAAAEDNPELLSLYTMVERDADGNLVAVPYHEAFAAQHQLAAEKLREAADLAEDPGLGRYLRLRADALLTGDYQPSDLAWMDMKDNTIDFVVGPVETYEDRLMGAKAANEAYVLVKDKAWSERLARYATLLPELQRGLPVPDEYKQEEPGSNADLGAYDVVYYAGDANAGSKTIAVNLPNDEEVQLQKGSRRLQLKNAMRAKFDQILEPIADELIVPEQRQHVTFDAFFANTMFHEVAHGLGIKNTLDGSQTVREAIQEHASALEEGKADVLGLYMIQALHADGEVGGELMDNYVTFLASIFRSTRFGASSAHGQANLIRFNYFLENGAFSRNEVGRYQINEDRVGAVVDMLSEQILRFQGDGDYDSVAAFIEAYAQIGPDLQNDLDRLQEAQIPVDIVFEQGADVLGL